MKELNYGQLKKLKKEQNAQLVNRHNKNIWDIVETLETMKPMFKDVIYKEGYSDCLSLLKRALKRMDEPNYAIIIRDLAIEVEQLKTVKHFKK